MRNPLVILLTALSAVSFLTGDARAGSVMALMVCLSVGLRFFQEARADAAAEKLKAMIHVTATVVRDGTAREMPLRDLVPGDIVKLAAGDMIPGDVRLLSLKDLFVSQGSLTGESLPVEKFCQPETRCTPACPPNSRTPVSWARVSRAAPRRPWSLRPGSRTYLGSMARSITGERVQTSFDAGLNRFTWLMMQFMAVMVPLVFLINGFTKHDWKGAFFFALAVAVGSDSRDAADDCLGLPLQRRARHEPQERDRQATQLDSELRWHGCPVHGQDRYAHRRPRRSHASLQCRGA